ncbi:integrase catalytic domain-containing protein [Trichonephila clavipes]|nr:integrase catalytic domain-containing protein [Trichonephila clavipes]
MLNPVTWKFIPPPAAWREQLVSSVKNLMVRVLDQASVNYEQLLTISGIEAVINCQPLTYISHESEDLLRLTPMFLQDTRVSGIVDLDILDRNKLLVHQRFCQELKEQIWSRFGKEYLEQFIQRHGQKDCELKVGDIV